MELALPVHTLPDATAQGSDTASAARNDIKHQPSIFSAQIQKKYFSILPEAGHQDLIPTLILKGCRHPHLLSVQNQLLHTPRAVTVMESISHARLFVPFLSFWMLIGSRKPGVYNVCSMEEAGLTLSLFNQAILLTRPWSRLNLSCFAASSA